MISFLEANLGETERGIALDSGGADYPKDHADRGMSKFVSQLRAALQDPSTSAEARIHRAEAILETIRSRRPPSSKAARVAVARGGLAPWQVRRTHDFIEERLSGGISCADLARLVRLSSHHFSRAFRVSFNESPHGYITKARIRRACTLMMTSAESLGHIATECGFSDQAHFNRVFRRIYGSSPGGWRRFQSLAQANDRAALDNIASTKIQSRGDLPNVLYPRSSL